MNTALLITPRCARRLHGAPAPWGWLDLAVLKSEGLAGVCGSSLKGDYYCHFQPHQVFPEHALCYGERVKNVAVWYRANDDVPVREMWKGMGRRTDVGTDLENFRTWVRQGWVHPPAEGFHVLLEDRSAEPHRWTAWFVTPKGVAPVDLIVHDPEADPFAQLDERVWPRARTAESHVAVIGVGSIGSAAAEDLSSYGIGTISLIDPDRLAPHNLVRHTCGAADVGRYKVDAVAQRLRNRAGTREVRPYRWNVITDADNVRGLLRTGVDVALICSDGVASRQACMHLCRWAGVDSVFACVLDDGAVGEIVRVPHRAGAGCLWCLRQHLRSTGALDPEADLDLPYGTGTDHRPMTAIGGDLALMGNMAAKAAVATLLQRAGLWRHRLVADHLIIGLQPAGDLEPPFGTDATLDMTVRPLPPPNPGCPACAASPLHRPL